MTGSNQPIYVAPNLDTLDLATMITRFELMRDAFSRVMPDPENSSRPADELRIFNTPNDEPYFHCQSYKSQAGCGFKITIFAHPETRPFSIEEGNRHDVPIDRRNDPDYILARIDSMLRPARQLLERKRSNIHSPGLTIEASNLFTDVETILSTRAIAKGLKPHSIRFTAGRPYRTFNAILGAFRKPHEQMQHIRLAKKEAEAIHSMLPPISAISIRDFDSCPTYRIDAYDLTRQVADAPSVIDEMRATAKLGFDQLALRAAA